MRPLLGGVAYTVGNQPLLYSFGVVAGPSFNRIRLEDSFRRRLPAGATALVGSSTSFAVRPAAVITWSVRPRVGIIGTAGYMFNRPDLLYRDVSGREFRNRWKADSIVLSVGAVYSIF